jgi:CRP-like cAMP-binding protein
MGDPKVDLLRAVPLFSHCSRKELQFLASRTDEVDVAPGVKLIEEGKRVDTFYLILEGEVEVDVAGSPRAVLAAGDFFGEISMLDGGPAIATVVVKKPAKLAVMSRSQFADAIQANQSLLLPVLSAVAARFRALR